MLLGFRRHELRLLEDVAVLVHACESALCIATQTLAALQHGEVRAHAQRREQRDPSGQVGRLEAEAQHGVPRLRH